MNMTTYNIQSENGTSTSLYLKTAKQHLVIASIPFILSVAGTGGILTAHSLEESTRLLHAPNIITARAGSIALDTLSPTQLVHKIRDAFSLNISDFANIFGVSRPTVYAWLDGQEPKPESLKHIQQLSKTADSVIGLNINKMDKLIHRPIFNGKSFLQKMTQNEDITDDLITLKHLSDKEAAARKVSKGSGAHLSSMAEVSATFSSVYENKA